MDISSVVMSEQQQQDPHLKLIENHIKDLLFNQSSPTDSTQQTPITPDLNYNMNSYRFPKKPFPPGSENTHLDTPISSMPLDCSLIKQPSNSSSQLIDLNVLTNFAAKHADISDISNTPRVLPHPELEDDSPITSGTNITKDILSNFNTSHEFKSSSALISVFENLKSNEKNVRQDHPNGAEQITSDKKKKKKTRRPNAKEKLNRKTQGSFEPINQSVLLLKPEPSKQDKACSNKHYPPQKGASKSPDKKKDVRHHRFSQLPTVPLPSGEIEFTLSLGKDGYKFLCNICNYEAKSRDYIHKHINSENHKDRRTQIKLDRELAFLPKPLPAQIEAIDELLLKYHAEYGFQEEDLILRKTLAARLIKLVETNLTDCSLEMIGSSVTGLGLKSSKVDFALKVEEEKNIPDSLELLYNTLLADPTYSKVESVFKKKRLGILFTDKETGLECTLVLENSVTEKFSKLFSMYSELDPRLKILASCFRYWAKICLLDNQDCGTLPPYTYSILLVFFLQQTEPPVLPVLQEVPSYGNNNFMETYVKANIWKTENTCSVGELWIQLFYYYNFIYEMGKQVVCIRTSEKTMCTDKNWSTKFYAIEDPFSRRNIAHVIPNFSVAQFIQQCFMKTYRHFAFPRIINEQIQLLKNHEFENLLQSYISSKSEAMEDLLMDDSMASDNEDSSIPDPDESGFLQDFEDQDPDIPIEDVLLTIKQMNLEENKVTVDVEILEDLPDEANISSSHPSPEKMESPKKEVKKNKERSSLKMEDRLKIQSACSWDLKNRHDLSVESFVYKMDPLLFKDKKEVPSSCKNCKGSGHLTKNCPNDYLPPKQELPAMTEDFHKVINKILLYIRDKHRVEDIDKDQMYKAMKDIEAHIQKLFPKANLCMFGSFCNGFGFKSRSDMDFCLTFKDHEDRKDLDCTEVIQKLAKHLHDYPKLENIVSVTSAKVPIVKFACKESGLEGDISLYNTLAIANTEMLEMYSRLDHRVQILGFSLKYFAKVLGICDASRGSLSSYAYILMVIFFLQQRDPPVIPVLQELHGEKKPFQMIEDWNVWYFKDFDKVPEIWPGYGKNSETVAELWLGLLSFYAYDFDWQEYVVSIRQKALLTRFRKLWITDQIAIEDPFDLNHNLGAGLSRKMNMYIFRTFIRARDRFGLPLEPNELLSLNGHEVKYFFDRRFLNSGSEPPHDRGCRKCGKIGHVAKNCPQEKLCSFCKKPGHLQRNCPKRKPQMKSKNSERNVQEPFSKESKNIIEAQNLQNHSLWPHGGDMQRANHQSHPLLKNSDGDITRSFLQMGYPSHRHPPPGFLKGGLMGPPPGFHQNNTKYRFPSNYPAPFPRTSLSQSPPKHYSCSPPKNYMGVNMYHPESFPSIGIRQELRMPHSDSMPHRMWGNQLPTRMPQPYSDRRKRTN